MTAPAKAEIWWDVEARRYHIRFDFHWAFIEWIRTVPSRFWHRDTKTDLHAGRRDTCGTFSATKGTIMTIEIDAKVWTEYAKALQEWERHYASFPVSLNTDEAIAAIGKRTGRLSTQLTAAEDALWEAVKEAARREALAEIVN